jgi:predicted GIY-YIG superfamily endonuclease
MDEVVYAMVDPRDDLEFYVGRTQDIYQRFMQHLRCEGKNDAKNARIRELKALHLLPIMKTLEVIGDAALAAEKEAYWIRHFRSLGRILANDVVYTEYSKREERQEALEQARQTQSLVPIEHFMYRTENGIKKRNIYISFEDAVLCTGYTVDELRVLVRWNRIKLSAGRDKLVLTSLKPKPYWGERGSLGKRKY